MGKLGNVFPMVDIVGKASSFGILGARLSLGMYMKELKVQGISCSSGRAPTYESTTCCVVGLIPACGTVEVWPCDFSPKMDF